MTDTGTRRGPIDFPKSRSRAGTLMAALLAAGAMPGTAHGADTGSSSGFLQTSIQAQETYTSNAYFGFQPGSRPDWITQITPSLVANKTDPNFQFNANLSVDSVNYARGSEPNMVLPSGNMDGIWHGVGDHLTVDAGAGVAQVPNYLYLPTPQAGATSFNTFSNYTYHINPDWKGMLPGAVQYDLQSQNGWSRAVGAPPGEAGNSYFGDSSVDFLKKPNPAGWEFRAEDLYSTYQFSGFGPGSGGYNYPPVRQEDARLFLRAALDPHWTVGLRGGIEREDFIDNYQWTSIVGGEFAWVPTERSNVSGDVERHYYGTTYHYSITHRNPWFATSITGGRDISTTPEEMFMLPATGNVASLLDAMLMTEYPDPGARALAVQNLITSSNLPNTLTAPTTVFAPIAFLTQNNQGSVAWLGHRNTVTVTVFDSSTRLIPSASTPAVAGMSSFIFDDVQRGATVNLNHRLTKLATVTATVTGSRVIGIGPQAGMFGNQGSVILQWNQALSAKSGVLFGLRDQYFVSPAGVNSFFGFGDQREKAAYVALTHTF
ncbi:methylene tetrahydrofolate reductase MetF [Burkholderiales bacterium GJ-E10]|nr:methylene tetrahydrofolate reductase MetF [Burkholderiales bacterium GJ-E10]